MLTVLLIKDTLYYSEVSNLPLPLKQPEFFKTPPKNNMRKPEALSLAIIPRFQRPHIR